MPPENRKELWDFRRQRLLLAQGIWECVPIKTGGER